MNNLINYLDIVSTQNNCRTYVIIDKLIDNFKFKIKEDGSLHDVRTLLLYNNKCNMKILIKILNDSNTLKLYEHVQIFIDELPNIHYSFSIKT